MVYQVLYPLLGVHVELLPSNAHLFTFRVVLTVGEKTNMINNESVFRRQSSFHS